MSLKEDIKSEIKEAKRFRLPWRILWCLAIGVASIRLLLVHFGKSTIALPTSSYILVVGFTIALKPKLRRRLWFWITMTVITALHVPLILFVPWPTTWLPPLEIASIVSVDLILVLAILVVVQKLVEGPKATVKSSHHDHGHVQ